MDHSVVMAAGGKVSFNSWLSSYLSERSIDVDVYLEYICGIAHTSGEGEEEELVSSLEEVLSGAVVSYSFSFRCCFYAHSLHLRRYIHCTWEHRLSKLRNRSLDNLWWESLDVRTYVHRSMLSSPPPPPPPPPQTHACTFMEDL